MTFNLRRWGVFNLVGFAGYVLQIATIAFLTRRFGWPSLVATAIGLEAAATLNFFLHSHWTWRETAPTMIRDWVRRYWKYQLAKTGSLAANLAVTMLLIGMGLPGEIANTLAVLACAIPNYIAAERLVYGQTA